ncbi:MAG: flagellar hook-length control protein FliK [Microvirga sp.]|nr:flagellar hook-length control protein FliK [Microvirga sp.]
MTPIDVPTAPAKSPGEAPGRRGAKSDAAGDDGPGSGAGRFADHWRLLAGATDEAAPGESGGAGERPLTAKERASRLDFALGALAARGQARSEPDADAGPADRKSGGEQSFDPAAALRIALGGEPGERPGGTPDALTPGTAGLAQFTAASVSPAGSLAHAAQRTAASGARETATAPNAPVAGGPVEPEVDLRLATRGADAPQEPLRARVLHQATHFTPVGDPLRHGGHVRPGAGQASAPGPSVVTPQPQAFGQPGVAGAGLGLANLATIADAIAQASAGDASARASTETGARPDGPRAGGPLRTLTIQLTPVSLGKLTVEMRLVDGAMRVDITVADARALEMVRSERDSILALVRSAGVTPESVTIQSADQAQGRQTGASAQGGGAMGGSFGERASRDESASRGGDPRNEARLTNEDGRPVDDASGGARGGGRDIYL